ncbi:hypothetical protein MMA231_03473 (plasmid) [Asticcacaulis sp. MM231]|uniref:glycosyltransferase family 2 protein n=1 Tax=Asticcacaulis sp. MM231 TaxID=3157666 RepID=UPI0032D58A55
MLNTFKKLFFKPAKTTSTVCLIAKNEAPYLVEWLAYYRFLGFNDIVIYENNSDDNSHEILSKLAAAGKVTHRTWTLGKNESPQITAYQDAIKRAETEWILFVDADEFLVLHHHLTVNMFLSSFADRPEVTAIGVNWRLFGDNNNKKADSRPVMIRFIMAAEPNFVVNRHLKSFSRVAALNELVHMHACATSGNMAHPSGKPLSMSSWGLSDVVELSVAQVNHYYTKTAEEYQKKKLRGQGGAGDDKPELKYWYNDKSFQSHNRNEIKDKAILKHYIEIKREIDELNTIVNT